jgi:hypothetical protein
MDKLQFKNDGTVERVAFTAEEEAARNADIIRVKEEDDARIAARQIIANGTDIKTAILAIKSDAQVQVRLEDIDQITWYDGNPTNITNQQITDKQAELQTAYDAKEYQRNRKKEYPEIADQLDDIYHNGIDAWKATIKVTKDKYPKPD